MASKSDVLNVTIRHTFLHVDVDGSPRLPHRRSKSLEPRSQWNGDHDVSVEQSRQWVVSVQSWTEPTCVEGSPATAFEVITGNGESLSDVEALSTSDGTGPESLGVAQDRSDEDSNPKPRQKLQLQKRSKNLPLPGGFADTAQAKALTNRNASSALAPPLGAALPAAKYRLPHGQPEVGGIDKQAVEHAGKRRGRGRTSNKIDAEAHTAAQLRFEYDDEATTLMVRNLPNDLTPSQILEIVLGDCSGMYDFFYLPWDLMADASVGYCFVNGCERRDALYLQDRLNNLGETVKRHKDWPCSQKEPLVCSWARVQGLKSNTERYRNCPIMHESVPERCKPKVFENGVKTDFPKPTRRIAAPKMSKYIAELGQIELSAAARHDKI